jgi:hypothetical protein
MRTRRPGSTQAPSSSHTRRRRRLATAATFLPLALGLASTQLPSGHPASVPSAGLLASPSCTLPFDSIKQHHPIDDSCGPSGNGKPGTPQAAQNQAKNDFCASGVPTNVDFAILRQLQQDAANKVTFGGDSKLPADRSLLRSFPSKVGTIGEGTVVRIAAFVIDAHYSNLGQGESVNCKVGDKESNDIHIVLGENSVKDDACTSVTAEMSPHFRPDSWNPDSLNQNNGHLFRFTGHLFFDASHVPCSGGNGPNPKRSSLWEIHPVYAVDICTDPNNKCTVDSDANWSSLSGFIGTETRLLVPKGRLGESPLATRFPGKRCTGSVSLTNARLAPDL